MPAATKPPVSSALRAAHEASGWGVVDPVANVISRWPANQPLAILHSADPARVCDHSRWSLIARPTSDPVPRASGSSAGPRPNFTDLLPTSPPRERRTPSPIDSPLLPRSSLPHSRVGLVYPPFTTGHLGYLSYDTGCILEPTAQHPGGAIDDRSWPLSHWLRIDDALIYDHAQDQWWALGDHAALLSALSPPPPISQSPHHFLSPPTSTTGHSRFLAQTRRVLDYIRAGDIYQVNLAHRLTASFSGSPRELFLKLSGSARPWYGSYLEFTDHEGRQRAIASASPELFLDFDPKTRRITTRPMKGTRRGDSDPSELLASEKDRAELNMIIDLMRNDLGRVCEFGSVRVENPRDLERHGGPSSPIGGGAAVFRGGGGSVSTSPPSLLQTTSTISGVLRAGLGTAELLAATLPGGSITGAPKIRAMQIIDELEPVRRGPYCGCIGFLGDDSRLSLNIAIRTALLSALGSTLGTPSLREGSSLAERGGTRWTLDYSVGAGIVADSDPESEWGETLAKAAVLGVCEP